MTIEHKKTAAVPREGGAENAIVEELFNRHRQLARFKVLGLLGPKGKRELAEVREVLDAIDMWRRAPPGGEAVSARKELSADVGSLHELKPARMEYVVRDEGGYVFNVSADLDDEWGWRGSVAFGSHGACTPEDAVRHLRHSVEAFLRWLDAEAKP